MSHHLEKRAVSSKNDALQTMHWDLWGNKSHHRLFMQQADVPAVRTAYIVLQKLKVAELLRDFSPTWVGTYPIGIHTPHSDLDIICEVHDIQAWQATIFQIFQDYEEFRWAEGIQRGKICGWVSFEFEGFPIEIFGESNLVQHQYAFRHMIIEGELLTISPPAFREKILQLKRRGLGTEPAFCQCLHLIGDPYEALLQLETWPQTRLASLLQSQGWISDKRA